MLNRMRVVQAYDVDALGGNALSTESTAKIIELLCAYPNGVQTMSQDIPGLVQTSLNLGVIKLGEHFNVTSSVRSSVKRREGRTSFSAEKAGRDV